VRVKTDAGIDGFGETDSMPSVVKSIIDAPYLHENMSGLRALLLGENPCDPERLWARMLRGAFAYSRDGVVLHAMAAVDIALWDIKGKAAEKPICDLLGGARRRSIRAYATHPLGLTLSETGSFAVSLIKAGYTALKFGWYPMGPDIELDTAIVRTLRAAAGPATDILIDGGIAWDTTATLARPERFDPYRIFWLEEPLMAYDFEEYRRLAEVAATPIAVGELASSVAELERFLKEARIDILQIDVSRVGLTQALNVARTAANLGIPCVNHTYSQDINLAASLHFVSSIELTSLFEVPMQSSNIRAKLVRNHPLVIYGEAWVPEGPGLGVEVNEEALAEFRVSG
jgi:L-alanine-DL-glutamate epimerase-like enolase superfamily enzyme